MDWAKGIHLTLSLIEGEKTPYCPVFWFCPLWSLEWFRNFSCQEQNPICQPIKWFAKILQFSHIHIQLLLPSSPFASPKKHNPKTRVETQNASPPSRSWSLRAQHIAAGRDPLRPKVFKVNDEKRKRPSCLVEMFHPSRIAMIYTP